ncbi:unnamed protein product [Enterobius vermicularis]|uniref:Oligopeptide transporter 1 n=1 Tax=Enterobius vermicularis TaxID=51028 RepID=A0A0N4VAJ7_ENTVE|nr:unnamed protein product [Enterobius vermicularis]
MEDKCTFDSGLTPKKQDSFGSSGDIDDRITTSASDLGSNRRDDLDPEPTVSIFSILLPLLKLFSLLTVACYLLLFILQTIKGIIKRWPKSTFCIIGNEFCERFSYTGMRSVLTLYVMNILAFSDNNATILFHSFIVLCYSSPVFGSILADGYIGKFWTIFWISLVYASGNLLLAVASTFNKSSNVHPYLDIAGLVIIGFGTGGIKPCVSAFGGDQFNPSHLRMISMFFSVFYFTVNVGSTLSTVITPELRTIQCNGEDSCYPLAFGIPAALMVLATVSFMSGSIAYKKYPPKENVMSRVVFTIGRALKNKWGSKVERDHWLEHYLDTHVCDEDPKCLALNSNGKINVNKCAQKQFLEEVKSLFSIIIVFLPVPMFWALYDQQGTRWIIQAVAMDAQVTESFTLLPDQMITFNAILVMIFIPLFQVTSIFSEQLFYIFISLLMIKSSLGPLRRLVAGGFLAAGAFIICGFLQLEVNKTLPDVPSSNTAFVSFVNTYPTCNINVSTPGYPEKYVAAGRSLIDDKIEKRAELYRLVVGESQNVTFNIKFRLVDRSGKSFYIIVSPLGISYEKAIWDKPTEGNGQSSLNLNFLLPCSMIPKSVNWSRCNNQNTYSERLALCKLYDNSTHPCNPRSKHYYSWSKDDISLQDVFRDGKVVLHGRTYDFEDVRPGKYQLYYINYNDSDSSRTPSADEMAVVPLENITLDIKGMGGVYTYTVGVRNITSSPVAEISYHTIVPKNHLNILWQVPQYAVITASEVLFSITGLEFAYSQAGPTMKSVVQAIWLVTVAVGDIIIIIISKLDLFDNLVRNFF